MRTCEWNYLTSCSHGTSGVSIPMKRELSVGQSTAMSFYSSFNANRHFKSPSPTLPSTNSNTRSPTSRFPLTRRYTRLLAGLVILFCLFFFSRNTGIDTRLWFNRVDHSVPPLYEKYHDYERHLPQHDLSLPFPEGRDAKFFWVPNHVYSMKSPCLH